MTPIYLAPDEISALCAGLVQPAAQVRALRALATLIYRTLQRPL
jgi:hypothetical protein